MYGQKAAIFTWHGCTLKMSSTLPCRMYQTYWNSNSVHIQVSGKTIVEYVGETPPMQRILNLHLALEAKRTAAEETNVIGPRVNCSACICVSLNPNASYLEGTHNRPSGCGEDCASEDVGELRRTSR